MQGMGGIKKMALAFTIAGTMALAGCGGGGGGSPTAPTSVTVSPSLGKFSSGAHVFIRDPKNISGELGHADTDATGKATVNIGSYSGPMLIEVTGGAGITYYDEGTDLPQPFTGTDTLRALAPEVLSEVGVTLATHAAVARAEADKTLANLSVDDIKIANNKVAAALGIIDVLQAPTLVGEKAKALDMAKAAGQYALQLAAWANLAKNNNNKTPLVMAKDLADDLTDDKLDGKKGNMNIAGILYTGSSIRDDLIATIKTAAADFATTDSENLIKADPALYANVTPDVTIITVPSGVNLTDLQKAKALFRELRTTLGAFSNGTKTGFLDTQATRMHDDLNANVTPEMSKVAGRISALTKAMGVFEDAKAYTSGNTYGMMSGSNPLTSGNTLVRQSGDFNAVLNGYGSFDYCWTDSLTPSAISKVTCAHAGKDSYDVANNRVKMVVYVLTGTETHQYTYTATRYNLAVSSGAFTSAAGVPEGSGTVSYTASGATVTGLTLNGTLPPSAFNSDGTPATGVDTVALSAARTALTTAYNYRYALSGSVSTTNLADSAKVVSLSLDSGSYIDLDEGADPTHTDAKILALKMIGTAKTAATQFTGTLDMGSVVANADGQNPIPTSVVFNGSISDLSTGGAGQILTGKLEATVASYNLYHSTQADSATNYKHVTLTFTGTVQAPSRPLMTLVLSATRTGLTTNTATLNYSYGTVSITGSGTRDSANPASDTLTLTNQDGIQVVLASGADGHVTKAGVTLATITSSNNMIGYVDGASESMM